MKWVKTRDDDHSRTTWTGRVKFGKVIVIKPYFLPYYIVNIEGLAVAFNDQNLIVNGATRCLKDRKSLLEAKLYGLQELCKMQGEIAQQLARSCDSAQSEMARLQGKPGKHLKCNATGCHR